MINKNNKKIDSFDDNYDYIDNLMTDIMSSNSEVLDENSASKENLVGQENIDKKIVVDNEGYLNKIKTSEAEEDVVVDEPVNLGLQNKRKPLLAGYFDEKETVSNDEKVVGKKSSNITADSIQDKSSFHHSIKEVDKVTDEDDSASSTPVYNSKETESKSTKAKDWSKSFSENYDKFREEDEIDEEESFDSMLADLVDQEDQDIYNDKTDNEVEVPLEKQGMEDIIVTSDGRSLAEMIPNIRGGTRKSQDVLADIKEQKRVTVINGKKFSDDRYLKHVVNAEEKMDDREKRMKLSQSFLQRHANFTEQEKTILNNLKISSEEFTNIMRSQELSLKDKEEIIGLGRYGPEKHFKGKRYRTTIGDLALLNFLVKFKFANTRILRWISHESQNTTWQKMKRLENNGLAESRSLIGVPDLWGSTLTGIGLSGYSLNPGLKPMPKMQTISSTMGVNYLAACLWFNTINVLNLDDFPAEHKFMGLESGELKRVRGEELISELEIRSSLGKEINPYSSTVKNLGDERLYDVIGSNVRNEIQMWTDAGKIGNSPEFMSGNEYMWILFPAGQLTLSYHVPDLVLRRERGPNGEPKSIAVELERYSKQNGRYDKTMLAYKLDEHLYESVIWVTPNARVARELDIAAKQVGFTRYSIVPIITETGVYNNPDIWMI